METTAAVLGIVWRRMRDSWRIQLVIAAGILVSAVLMASTSIYTRAVSDLSLTVTLRNQLEDRRQLFVSGSGVLASSTSAAADRFVDESLRRRWGELETGRRLYRQTVPLLADGVERPRATTPGTAYFAALDGALEQLEIEQGRLPRAPEFDAGGRLRGPVEALVPSLVARAYELEPGSQLTIRDRYDECDREPDPPPGGPPPPPTPPCAPTLAVERTLEVRVAGLIRPDDWTNEYWRRLPERLTAPTFVGSSRQQQVPLILDEDAFDGALPQLLSGYLVQQTWTSELDTDQLNVANMPDAQETFDLLREDLRSIGASAFSPIEARLDSFERDLSFTRAPILLLLAQVVGIALFYVTIVSGILVAQRREELFALRSRGASLRQVLGSTAIEGLALALVAAAAGPFIAAGAIALLGYTGVFSGLTGGAAISTTLTPDSFLLSAGGALAAAAFMLAPLWAASRTRVLAERLKSAAGAAGSTVNALQRYYLDVALVLVAAGLIFEADLRGTVFERNSVGGLSADPLLLSTPALFALAAALVIMRLLPWAYRFAAWVSYDRAPLPIAATLRYVARTIGPSARLTILLMLGAALGTFAASWSGTVDRSLAERIQYASGVEARAELDEGAYSSPEGVRDRLAPVEGIRRIETAFREGISAGRSRGDAASATLLGVFPDAAREMLWFRGDFSERTYDELLAAIDVPPTGRGVGIPDDTQTLRVWIDVAPGEADQTLWLRVRDGRGLFQTAGGVPLPEPGSGWTAVDIDFAAEIAGTGRPPPYTLHGIQFSEPFGVFVAEPVEVRVDAITAIHPDGRELVVEDFEDGGWVLNLQRRAADDVLDFAEAEDAVSGGRVLSFTPGIGQSPGRRGVYYADPSLCPRGRCELPVIMSEGLAAQQRLEEGDRFTMLLDTQELTGRVAAIVPLFPTLRPDERPFLVVDYDALYHLRSATNLRPASAPSEVWLDLSEDPELRAAAIAELQAPRYSLGVVDDLDEELFESGRDPLTAAGGSGILLVAFIAITVLLALAFLVSMAVSARQRRLEMALLRTMGVGRWAILLQLLIEYALVAGAGLALGVLLGNRISLLQLGYLEIDDEGRTVLPPFVIETDWLVLGISFAVLGGVLLLGVLATWRWFLRLELNRELRLTN